MGVPSIRARIRKIIRKILRQYNKRASLTDRFGRNYEQILGFERGCQVPRFLIITANATTSSTPFNLPLHSQHVEDTMRKLRYNIAATLDGYIASQDHTTTWIIEDPTIDFASLYGEFSTFIMGRKTYETMISFGDQNPLRNLEKEAIMVVSRTGQWPEVTVIKDGVVNYVRDLKAKEGGKEKDIWFMGGATLAGILIKEQLLDTLEVAVMPAVIGEGVKMVELSGESPVKLEFESVETKTTGILMTRYRFTYDNA